MHVLIVEDKKSMAEMLKQALDEKGHSAELAFDGLRGLDLATHGDFDVVVLDLMLPGLDGHEVVRRLRQAGNKVPVLALTARDTVADVVATLDIGVDDYLTKPFAMAEFMARLRAAGRRGPAPRASVLEVDDIALDSTSCEVTRAGEPVSLTRTEYLLLECLMRRAGQALTRHQIIDRVWGKESGIEENTLEAFIKNVRAKVDNDREVKLIQTIRGVGYRMSAGGRP